MRYSQYGGNIPYFKGSIHQRGYGLGGIFKGLARSPILRKALVHVGKKALETGGRVISDLANGKNIKESIKQRSKEGAKQVFKDFLDGPPRASSSRLSGSSIKHLTGGNSASRKRASTGSRSKRLPAKRRRKKQTSRDIFD